MNLHDLKNDIQKFSDPEKGKFLQRFFKTGKDEYAEGDIFLGLTVPQSRLIAKKYKDLAITDCEKLLQSPLHEERLIALFILVLQFTKGDEKVKKEIYDLYLSNTKWINNWDLVDSSADKIIGEYLWLQVPSDKKQAGEEKAFDKLRQKGFSLSERSESKGLQILEKLARSEDIWEKRISIIATFAFIKHGSAEETLKIAEILLYDKHDLIHKAVGWMLREMGKKVSLEKEEMFLRKHCKMMPRTMLRYAIELFPEEKRKTYLSGNI